MKIVSTVSAIAATVLLIGAQAVPALAEEEKTCRERDQVLDMLSDKFDEDRVAIGLTEAGGLVEVLSAREGGTWTIIVTSPGGISCLVAAGTDWQSIKTRPPEDPEA